MPPTPEEIARTLRFVQRVFEGWYRRHPPPPPPRLGRREFGFMFLGKSLVQRHLSFSHPSELHRFLREKTPSHVYYSTAYYENPSAPSMEKKGWLGADLIFDLDADHLPGSKDLPWEESLVRVRSEARKLVEEFVLGDFGFDEESVRVYFSGSRGYHIHVRSESVWTLGSAPRREIVDYVEARGLDLTLRPHREASRRTLLRIQKEKRMGRGSESSPRKFERSSPRYLFLPPEETPGWGGRWTRGLRRTLEELARLDPKEAVKELTKLEGVGEKTAESFLRRIRQGGIEKLELFTSGFSGDPVLRKLATREDLSVRGMTSEKGGADEPVTTDIKRLIRLPGSLHGKTGLCVTPVPLDTLARFDPLREAVVLGEDPVRIRTESPVEFHLKGERFRLDPGVHTLPEYAAIFLILGRKAIVEPDPSRLQGF